MFRNNTASNIFLSFLEKYFIIKLIYKQFKETMVEIFYKSVKPALRMIKFIKRQIYVNESWIKPKTLLNLRWLAIAGQFIAILVSASVK